MAALRARALPAARSLAQVRSFSLGTRLRQNFDFKNLHEHMTKRQLPLLYDRISEKPEMQLANTLCEFLPTKTVERIVDESELTHKRLPMGHHLIYFPPSSLLSELLPDGTDPEQSPGGPFVRRMWAGGKVMFPKEAYPLKTNNEHACCYESIKDVQVKGKDGDEKIFVTIERRISRSPVLRGGVSGGAWASRGRITDHLDDDELCSVIEERNLVFMKERTPEELKNAGSKARRKALKAPHEPTLSFTYKPTRPLLFRFSALTWNAHSIHLDRGYARDIEGYDDLLVHGPLSLVMILELLSRYRGGTFGDAPKKPFQHMDSFEYRNIAPLYANEECKVCLRDEGKGKYELWIENSEGGMCVKGSAVTH